MFHSQPPGVVTESDGARVIWPPGTTHEQPLIVQKSDGGFGYDSTDMAAIWYRLFEKDAKWIVYVTDAGQASHFERLVAAAAAAGWAQPGVHRIDHVPFGLVCGADGKKYKTRSGEVVRLVDLLDEAVSRMYDVTVEHNQARRPTLLPPPPNPQKRGPPTREPLPAMLPSATPSCHSPRSASSASRKRARPRTWA
jgi:arginyl-tRNA synthetase